MKPLFASRAEAGRLLAGRIAQRGFLQPVVLALPGPGVLVALEVAQALRALLDVVVPLAEGQAGGASVFYGWTEQELPHLTQGHALHDMEADLRRRERLLRGNSPALRLQGTTTLVADDGSATAADLRSAVLRVRKELPRRVVLVAPVVSTGTMADLGDELDGCIRLFEVPDRAQALGAFGATPSLSDEQVASIVHEARSTGPCS
jgi:putative phosphoribosyl transferase